MDLRHIRVFLTVAEELHFGRAALRLRVAQSAISQTIQSLEDDVGTRLFERTKRRVALTPAGAAFVEHARRVLDEVERAKTSARNAGSGEAGELSLAFTLMAALTPLPRAVAAYQRRYPQVRLHIESRGSREQLQAIGERHCDVGFMSQAAAKRGVSEDPALVAEPLEQSPLFVVLKRQHPLARRRAIQLRALAAEPMIFLRQRDEPEVSRAFRRRCEQLGFEPKIVVEVEDVESVLAFVAAGVGVACVPGLVKRLSFAGVVAIRLQPEILTGIWAVHAREAPSATTLRFLEILRDR